MPEHMKLNHENLERQWGQSRVPQAEVGFPKRQQWHTICPFLSVFGAWKRRVVGIQTHSHEEARLFSPRRHLVGPAVILPDPLRGPRKGRMQERHASVGSIPTKGLTVTQPKTAGLPR